MRLTDIQYRAKLFSTFRMSLLAEIYATFPEIGAMDQPGCILYIDETYLIFDTASKALRGQIGSVLKHIRSKEESLYFVAQNQNNIPKGIASHLGLKIQHAPRAFAAKDRKALKLITQNYPETDYYDTARIRTSIGIGETFINALYKEERPSPLATNSLRAPKKSHRSHYRQGIKRPDSGF